MSRYARIDTHQHVIPPGYADWLADHGLGPGAPGRGGVPYPGWSRDGTIAMMDDNHCAVGVLSLSAPGVHLGDDAEARRRAREVNEFAAEVVKDRPDRFGFFATLTLPDVDGAIAEAEYALGALQADGVILLANAGGTYLGDASFDPLMAALNESSAVTFVHPGYLPGPAVPGVPGYAADFLLDTTRAAYGLARSGAMDRYPNLKIILSHAGGFVPYAAERLAVLGSPDAGAFQATLRRFWFDTALSSPTALPSLLAFADPARITFGSDWPFATAGNVAHFSGQLDAFELADQARRAIDLDNATRLFGRDWDYPIAVTGQPASSSPRR